MKILYFTASGNCLAVAKRFDAELLSIPQLIKEGQYGIEADAIGIIYPVYDLTAPEMVKRYIRNCHLKATYIFVIGTYGNADGATLYVMKKLLESNGNRADYFETLLMVDNYLPGFEMRDEVNRLEEKETERELARIVDEVNRRIKKYNGRGLGWKLASAVLNSAQGGVVKSRSKKWFSVNDDCIGCGICSRVCPVSNITQTDKSKPVFGGNCESCFACVHNCPKKAIHLKNEKSGERFRNPAVSVNDSKAGCVPERRNPTTFVETHKSGRHNRIAFGKKIRGCAKGKSSPLEKEKVRASIAQMYICAARMGKFP